MREIGADEVREAVLRCIERASFDLDAREAEALQRRLATERSCAGCSVLRQLVDNAEIARAERRPLCQDTGVAVVRLTIGRDIRLRFDPVGVVHEAVREGWRRFGLRPSMVRHPLDRGNTGDNTPAVVHLRLAEGDRMEVDFMEKGGGCENMSRLAMLTPADGRAGVVDFVVRTVVESGGNACPPLVVGVGLGGTFELAAMLAKDALLRPFGEPAEDPLDRGMEAEVFERLNATGLGPMGLGGDTTALAVHVKSHPCHIASLPVAVNLDCHSHRHTHEVV